MVYILVFLIALVALVYVAFNYFKLRRMEEGTEEMSDLAGIIRSGARTFMRAEYKIDGYVPRQRGFS